MKDLAEGAEVTTNGGTFSARWVFSSMLGRPKLEPQHMFLKQHFGGWWIESEHSVFEENAMTLMDFGVSQEQEVRFVYCLPFSPTRALVEFTVFSENAFEENIYDHLLGEYMQQRYPGIGYSIVEKEKGIIPMTNYSFEARPGNAIWNIGTAAGLTKATTGYTFKRIQEDSRQLVASLEQQGFPQRERLSPPRFAFYDSLLLYLIQNRPLEVKYIFEQLFSKNPISRILQFLDEETSLVQDLQILGRLPWKPFLRALFDYYVCRKYNVRKRKQLVSPEKQEVGVEYSV